ncbi:MAG: PIN domain-containing protein [Deltaproteobacteria bacterium]|nr:PIN domain-containing protein [Deltaproteobacteria bacterium]
MYLVDTNVFLEILLGQEKKEACKRFLQDTAAGMSLSDFSLHSVGVILFRYNKEGFFLDFIRDTLPRIRLLSLPPESYSQVVSARRGHGLDFDDAYQYALAKQFGLRIVTMDRDFERTRDDSILYL